MDFFEELVMRTINEHQSRLDLLESQFKLICEAVDNNYDKLELILKEIDKLKNRDLSTYDDEF